MDKFKKYDEGIVATEWVARNLSGLKVAILRKLKGHEVLDPYRLVRVLGYRQSQFGKFFVVAQDPAEYYGQVADPADMKLYSDPVEGAGKVGSLYVWRFREVPPVSSMFEDGSPAVDPGRFPHQCRCGAPAYRGFNTIECSAAACPGRW